MLSPATLSEWTRRTDVVCVPSPACNRDQALAALEMLLQRLIDLAGEYNKCGRLGCEALCYKHYYRLCEYQKRIRTLAEHASPRRVLPGRSAGYVVKIARMLFGSDSWPEEVITGGQMRLF